MHACTACALAMHAPPVTHMHCARCTIHWSPALDPSPPPPLSLPAAHCMCIPQLLFAKEALGALAERQAMVTEELKVGRVGSALPHHDMKVQCFVAHGA